MPGFYLPHRFPALDAKLDQASYCSSKTPPETMNSVAPASLAPQQHMQSLQHQVQEAKTYLAKLLLRTEMFRLGNFL